MSPNQHYPLFRERFFRGFAHLITSHPLWVMGGALLFGFIFWAFLPRLVLRPDVDDFIAVKDPSFAFRSELRRLFPNNEFAVIAIQSDTLFSPEMLGMLQVVTEELEGKETVKSVRSLANVNITVGKDDAFMVDRFLTTLPSTAEGSETLRKRAVRNPLYQDRLISRDGRTTAIIVYTRTENLGPSYREELMRDIQSVLTPFESRGMRFHLAGWPVTNYFLASYMNQDLIRFLPVTLFLVIITIWFVFKNVRLLILAGVGIAATVAATLGLTSMLGVSLNNASVAVVPIVIALALSDNVHVFSHLSGDVLRTFPNRREALSHVLEQILYPCSLTSLNTAIGFFSLSFSGIPSIQAFGWLAGAGMVFEFVFTFGIVTPLLLAFRPESIYRDTVTHHRRFIPRMIRWVHQGVLRRPWWVLSFCLVCAAWGGWQSRRIRSETNLLEFFQPEARVRSDANFVRDHLAGITALDLFVEGEEFGTFREPSSLAYLDQLEARVKRIPGVDSAISLVDYFKDMNKSFHNEDPAFFVPPATRRLADQYLLLYNAKDLEDFVTSDFRKARISLRLRSSSTRDMGNILEAVDSILPEGRPSNLRARMGGEASVNVATAQTLVGGQVQNVFSAVFTIWLVMAVVLRSMGMSTLFLVPNLFPILINFGIMGYFGIPLDTGTSLIAAAAFGVIVDDTVHFFTRFQQLRGQGLPYFEALEKVSFEKGEASTSSFVIMCAGFGVLSLSHFRPIMYFGVLNVVVLMVGFVGDQFLLKSILALWGRRTSSSLSASHAP